ncbi:hypothetical protein GCM10027355_07470 [Haloplanus salinarum]
MTRRSPTLDRQHPENFVDVHPTDAERYGVGDGDVVTPRSRRGEIDVAAQVTDDIKEGTIWTTIHFAASSANRLTNDVLDERAKIPEYEASAVETSASNRRRRPATTERRRQRSAKRRNDGERLSASRR